MTTQAENRKFMVIVGAEDDRDYVNYKHAKRRLNELVEGGETRQIKIIDRSTSEVLIAVPTDEEIEHRAANDIDLDNRMDAELAGLDDGFEKIEAYVASERASADDTREPKKRIRVVSGPQTAGGTPTPGVTLGLNEANKYTKRLDNGTFLVETNPNFVAALREHIEGSSELDKILSRRTGWVLEILDADELETLIIFIGALADLAHADKTIKPRAKTLGRMLDKLVNIREVMFVPED